MTRALFVTMAVLLSNSSWADLKIIRSSTDLLECAADESDQANVDSKVPVPQEVPNAIGTVLGGAVLDLRSWLEHYGCNLDEHDIAIFFPQQGLVVVRSNESTIDLVEHLVEACVPLAKNLRFVLKLSGEAVRRRQRALQKRRP